MITIKVDKLGISNVISGIINPDVITQLYYDNPNLDLIKIIENDIIFIKSNIIFSQIIKMFYVNYEGNLIDLVIKYNPPFIDISIMNIFHIHPTSMVTSDNIKEICWKMKPMNIIRNICVDSMTRKIRKYLRNYLKYDEKLDIFYHPSIFRTYVDYVKQFHIDIIIPENTIYYIYHFLESSFEESKLIFLELMEFQYDEIISNPLYHKWSAFYTPTVVFLLYNSKKILDYYVDKYTTQKLFSQEMIDFDKFKNTINLEILIGIFTKYNIKHNYELKHIISSILYKNTSLNLLFDFVNNNEIPYTYRDILVTLCDYGEILPDDYIREIIQLTQSNISMNIITVDINKFLNNDRVLRIACENINYELPDIPKNIHIHNHLKILCASNKSAKK